MKLFYSPNACSLGIHVLLEEIGKPFELMRVDFSNGAQYKEPYVSLNPKSKVPALGREDGTLVTEWPAVAWYLAKANPVAAFTNSEGCNPNEPKEYQLVCPLISFPKTNNPANDSSPMTYMTLENFS